jgi:predicted  nucleic acid-binding Zn-ribbon protein
MSGPATLFREIHRLRRFAHDLQEQIDRLPRQQKAQEAKVTRQEEILHEAHDAIKHLKVEIHAKEVSLKSTHTQIAKHQKQLNEAESKKEYDALQHEINEEKAACLKLEEEILTSMAESEDKTAQLPELEKAVRQAKEEYAKFEAGMQERLTGYRTQREETQKKLEVQETSIPEKLRTQYERIVAAQGPDAMSAVQGRTCAACYTEITAQQYNELQQELSVLCKSCGRFLYLPE